MCHNYTQALEKIIQATTLKNIPHNTLLPLMSLDKRLQCFVNQKSILQTDICVIHLWFSTVKDKKHPAYLKMFHDG